MKINEVIQHLTENKEGKFINTSDCARLRSIEYCKEHNTIVFHGDEYVLLGIGLDDEFIIDNDIKPERGLRAKCHLYEDYSGYSEAELNEKLKVIGIDLDSFSNYNGEMPIHEYKSLVIQNELFKLRDNK